MNKTFIRSAVAVGTLMGTLISPASEAQVLSLPYYTGFDIIERNGEWSRYVKGATNDNDFPWSVMIHHPYSAPFSLLHTCDNGGGTTVDDWYVSKAFNFPNGGQIDSLRCFLDAQDGPRAGDTVAIYLVSGAQDPAQASTRTLLYDYRGSTFVKNSWIKTTGIAIPPTQGNCHIAFRYRAVDNCMNVFFDNVAVSGRAATGIRPAGDDTHFTIAPNPVTDVLRISADRPFSQMRIYSAAGKLVYSGVFSESADVSGLAPGMYLVELTDKQSLRSRVRMIKQ